MEKHIYLLREFIQNRLERFPRAIRGEAPMEHLIKICDEIDMLNDLIALIEQHGMVSDEQIEKDLDETSNVPKNFIDVNEERVSKTGNLIPSDSDVYDVLLKMGDYCSSKEISGKLSDIKLADIKTVHITNALGRLVVAGRAVKNSTKPVTWSAKKPKPIDANFYANDEQRLAFIKDMGFKTIEEAVKEMGSWGFEIKLKEWVKLDAKNK